MKATKNLLANEATMDAWTKPALDQAIAALARLQARLQLREEVLGRLTDANARWERHVDEVRAERDALRVEVARLRAQLGGPVSDGDGLLPIFLSAAVPLRIAELRLSGGPTPAQFEQAREFGAELGEKGDRILYQGSVPGETARLANRLAEVVAVLAFCPGGIHLFGTHWVGVTDGEAA